MIGRWFGRLWMALLLLAPGLCLAQPQTQTLPAMTMGIYLPVVRDVPRKDVEVSLNFWILEMAKDANLGFNPVHFYTDLGEMKRDFESATINFVVAPALSVARLFRMDDLADGFTAYRQVPDDLILVVRRDAGIRTPADLPGKRMALLKDDELSDVYLDTLMLNAGKSGTADLMSVTREERSKNLIYRLFFNKADATLIYRNSYDTAVALNPQVAATLQILDGFTFKTQAPYTALFSKRVTPEDREVITRSALKVDNSPRGQQVVAIYQADHMARTRVADLLPYQQLLQDHQALKAGLKPVKKVAR